MNQLSLFRDIKEIADEFYFSKTASKNSIEYLKKAQEFLCAYFKDSGNGYSQTFVYSTMSYIDKRNNDKTMLIKRNDSDLGYDFNKQISNRDLFNNIEKLFHKFITRIKNNEVISLTKVLFKSCKPDFIISNSNEYGSEKVIKSVYLNTKIDFEPEINKFIKSYSLKEEVDYDNTYKEKVTEYFYEYYNILKEFKKIDFPSIHINFIKPYLPENKDNVLLTLCTTEKLTNNERAFINLILYKIVSYMATNEMIENAELKRKTSFSLTTHSLKTELGNSLIKQYEIFENKYKSIIENELENFSLSKNVAEIKKNIYQLYALTGILALIDKIDDIDKTSFLKSAENDKLLTKNKGDYDIVLHLENFNKLRVDEDTIVIINQHNIKISEINFKILEYYFHENLLKVFFDTIFENILKHGKTEENRYNLRITKNSENQVVFSNKMHKEEFVNQTNRLKGNLDLFKLLINNTKSGMFEYQGKNHIFEIKLKFN